MIQDGAKIMSRGLLRVAWLALLLTTIDCDPKTGEFFLPGATSPQVGNLTGTVSSGTSPISGATVALSGTPTRSTTTSSTGVYDFFDLPIGPLTITTTAALFTCPSQTVTIVLNQTVTSNIACTPLPGSVTGTVRVAGVGQSGIAVTLTQGTATIGTATTGAGGTYTIANVPPGTYSVAVTAPSGADCSPNPKNVTVQSGQATTADFGCVLLPGQISGTVRLSGALRQGSW